MVKILLICICMLFAMNGAWAEDKNATKANQGKAETGSQPPKLENKPVFSINDNGKINSPHSGESPALNANQSPENTITTDNITQNAGNNLGNNPAPNSEPTADIKEHAMVFIPVILVVLLVIILVIIYLIRKSNSLAKRIDTLEKSTKITSENFSETDTKMNNFESKLTELAKNLSSLQMQMQPPLQESATTTINSMMANNPNPPDFEVIAQYFQQFIASLNFDDERTSLGLANDFNQQYRQLLNGAVVTIDFMDSLADISNSKINDNFKKYSTIIGIFMRVSWQDKIIYQYCMAKQDIAKSKINQTPYFHNANNPDISGNARVAHCLVFKQNGNNVVHGRIDFKD